MQMTSELDKRQITPELAEAIFIDWNKGISAGVLAEKYGVSRNAIIGKVARERKKGRDLRFEPASSRAYAFQSKRKRELVPLPDPDEPPKPIAEIVKPPSARKPYTTRYHVVPMPKKDRTMLKPGPKPKGTEPPKDRWVPILKTGMHTCRYSVDGLFCNEPVEQGKPMWCAEHYRKVYNPTQPVRK